MKLNDAKDIRIGSEPVQEVYLGETLIWSRNKTDLTDYFDCRYGLTETSWKNLAGGNDIRLHGNAFTHTDGSLVLYDPKTDFGELESPFCENRTFYCLFRTDPFGVINDNVYLWGAGIPDIPDVGKWISLCCVGYKDGSTIMGIALDRFYIHKRTSVLSTEYHLAAVTVRQNGSGYTNALYIDGVFMGQFDTTMNYGDTLGIGTIWYPDRGSIVSPAVNKYIRHFSVYNTAHDAQRVAEISRKILQEFEEI